MTLTVPEAIYRAAGSPAVIGLESARGACFLCGADLCGQGVPYRIWVRPTFTDHDKARRPDSDYLCAACVFCGEERSIVLQQRLGRDKAPSMRNYSHFVIGGVWQPLSKGDKVRMRRLLAEFSTPHDVVLIAESGQKHLTFRARPGLWQFEEHQIVPDRGALEWLLSLSELLYEGFSKAEIKRGDYAAHRIMRFGLNRFRELEAALRPWRGSAMMDLALFLAQRTENGPRRAGGEDSAIGAPKHGLECVGPQAAEVLADTDKRGEGSRLHQLPESVRQLPLFPDADSGTGTEQGRPRRG